MDFNLTEEQELIQKTARDFAMDHLRPGVIERDEKAEFPKDQIKMMGELGFLGMMIPEKYGGAGMDTISYCLAMEEIAKADASAAVVMSVNNSLVCQLLYKYGNEDQKQKYLTKLTSGKLLGAFSLSEPQSGSDASNMRTFAKRDGDNYIINGTKNWVTNGISSDIVILMCMTVKNVGYKGITTFVVEKSFDGFSTGKKEDKLGIRGSDTCELYFDDCKVPVENRIGEEGEGFRIALGTLDGGRVGIATQALGIAAESLARSVEYAKERKQFGQPVADFQGVQFQLAKAATDLEVARLAVYNAARLRDAGQPFRTEAAMCKLFSSEVAERVTSLAVQLYGGYGYVRDYPVEKLYRDAKIGQIYEGTSNLLLQTIAKQILEK